MMSVDHEFVDPYHRPMKNVIKIGFAALCLLLVLFDVTVDLQFSTPREVEIVDVAQEAQYHACVDERDAEIHRIAFGTIDNPDVQREYLSTHKDKAKAACRLEYPEQMTTEMQSFQFKLLKFEYRF